MMLAHLHELAHASDLPLNADFEAGYADDLAGVAENVRLAVESGVSGLSIEDGANRKLYAIDDAVARLRAARGAIDKAGGDVLLVGRCECFLLGRPDIEETVARLKAYSNAGADCLYAPGLKTREQIDAVLKAGGSKPVNVIMSSGAPPLTVANLAALGVRRISVGGALARVAWLPVMRVAKQIMEEGRFDGLNDSASGAELNALFRDDLAKRTS
jgi:2-methylisocitrate lyase-like PEP mutase family enzyme